MNKCFLIMFLCMGVFLKGSAEIHLEVNRDKVGINESFTVNYTLDDPLNAQPDFSPLYNDFEILSSGQSQQVHIVNGRMHQEISLNLVLRAKREGALTIPSISFGKENSPARDIEVTATHVASKDDSIFLETEILPKGSAYEQTQLNFFIRLYRSVNLAQGSLSEVKTNDPDALIERLGSDSEYEYIHPNGNRYVVLERKYAIVPQHEGELLISPIVFEGQIVKNGYAFFNFQADYIRLASDPVSIQVKPIPSSFQRGNWFAANDVKISEEWSSNPERVPVGEPITLTLKIVAEGCLANQIPEITFNLPPGIKQYSDKPELLNEQTPKGNIGSRQNKIALIGTQPGNIQLPEIKFQWWDLKNEQVRTAYLPAREIKFEAEPLAMNTPLINSSDAVQDKEAANIQSFNAQEAPLWMWALIGLNILWIVPCCLFLLKKFQGRSTSSDGNLKQIRGRLKEACKNNFAKQAEESLIAWGANTFPNQRLINLVTLQAYVSEPLAKALEELNQSLYGQQKNWDGKLLWNAFSNFKPQKNNQINKNNKVVIRELYPTDL